MQGQPRPCDESSVACAVAIAGHAVAQDANDHPGVGTYDHDHDGIANRSLREARNCKTKKPSKPAERGGWTNSTKGPQMHWPPPPPPPSCRRHRAAAIVPPP